MGRDRSKYDKDRIQRLGLVVQKSTLEGWREEPAAMNDSKKGGRFVYPDSLMETLAGLKQYFRRTYRDLQGLMMWLKAERVPHYSTINRRISRLKLKPDAGCSDNAELVADGTGIKVSSRGDRTRARHGAEVKGFVKLHVTCDMKTGKIVACEITDDSVHDGKCFKPMAGKPDPATRIDKIYGDGACDTRENFTFPEDPGAGACIPVRKNSSTKVNGCMAGWRAVMDQISDRTRWEARVEYGHRWLVETAFSVLKSLFGEGLMSRTFENMKRELLIRINLHNKFIEAS